MADSPRPRAPPRLVRTGRGERVCLDPIGSRPSRTDQRAHVCGEPTQWPSVVWKPVAPYESRHSLGVVAVPTLRSAFAGTWLNGEPPRCVGSAATERAAASGAGSLAISWIWTATTRPTVAAIPWRSWLRETKRRTRRMSAWSVSMPAAEIVLCADEAERARACAARVASRKY
jgi:hypothetical protein